MCVQCAQILWVYKQGWDLDSAQIKQIRLVSGAQTRAKIKSYKYIFANLSGKTNWDGFRRVSSTGGRKTLPTAHSISVLKQVCLFLSKKSYETVDMTRGVASAQPISTYQFLVCRHKYNHRQEKNQQVILWTLSWPLLFHAVYLVLRMGQHRQLSGPRPARYVSKQCLPHDWWSSGLLLPCIRWHQWQHWGHSDHIWYLNGSKELA